MIDSYSLEMFGRDVADAYMFGFFGAFEQLTDFPESGARYDRVDASLRCLPYRSHRIFYDYDGTTVTIVRILHQAMDGAGNLN
jgi:toxin ParE1/3/4